MGIHNQRPEQLRDGDVVRAGENGGAIQKGGIKKNMGMKRKSGRREKVSWAPGVQRSCRLSCRSFLCLRSVGKTGSSVTGFPASVAVAMRSRGTEGKLAQGS